MSEVQSEVTNRAKLIKALRSGEYKQAKGKFFETDGSMCFVGLMSRIFNFEAGHKAPQDVASLIGVQKYNIYDFVRQNDNGVSFIQLADQLEQMPITIGSKEEKVLTSTIFNNEAMWFWNPPKTGQLV